ncbi:MAG: hypothetical protein OXM57_07405 [bacterium]|nr:hypothetical protein [bacterium]MDE0352504.1 hypothetical protein [bacterium]
MTRPAYLRAHIADERGAGAIDLVLVSAFILIPFAMLLLSFPIRMEYRSMTDAAAREAVRACATAFDPDTGQDRAEAVARRILAERSLASGTPDLTIDCRDSWAPGGVVSARVSLDAPAINVMGSWTLGSWTFTSSYREQMEPYRSIPRP